METCKGIIVDTMPAHTTAFPPPMNKERNFSFKFDYLKNRIHGAIGAVDSSSYDRWEWKTSWKSFFFCIDATKSICCDYQKEGINVNFKRSLKTFLSLIGH